ncbi:hydrolase-like protein 5 [Elsinoe australis]|uniref:Hydrolase-like protein 5 n=1 Tax=Elsinoe australis TaxID=40998 RepID=A0A4U7ATY6_9PEZI|nr:hydrolase-like protein 5 [Elsinoe australis]
MSTGLPRQCCATGSLHTGTPTGTVSKLHGFDAYIARPPQDTKPKGSVVIIPDIFGWTLPNTRILADEYAKKGPFNVYLPNFMNGNAPGFTALLSKAYHFLRLLYHGVPFLIRNRASAVLPGITSFFKTLRENEDASLPIGAAGFCWGGMPVVKLCQDGTKASNGMSLVDVGFIAHPSFMKMPDDVEVVVKPLSCAGAGNDGKVMLKQGDQIKDVLERKNREAEEREGGRGVRHEYVWYEKADHGFAVRTNEKDTEAAEKGKMAEAQAVGWFQRWFGEWRESEGR